MAHTQPAATTTVPPRRFQLNPASLRSCSSCKKAGWGSRRYTGPAPLRRSKPSTNIWRAIVNVMRACSGGTLSSPMSIKAQRHKRDAVPDAAPRRGERKRPNVDDRLTLTDQQAEARDAQRPSGRQCESRMQLDILRADSGNPGEVPAHRAEGSRVACYGLVQQISRHLIIDDRRLTLVPSSTHSDEPIHTRFP